MSIIYQQFTKSNLQKKDGNSICKCDDFASRKIFHIGQVYDKRVHYNAFPKCIHLYNKIYNNI